MRDYTESIEAARGDADALYRLATELHGVVRFLSGGVKQGPRVRRPSADGAGEDSQASRATWLTPILEVWEKERGGVFPPAGMKPFAQLRKKGHTEHEIAKRLGYYLRSQARAGQERFDNVVKFASQFNLYNPDQPAWPDEE